MGSCMEMLVYAGHRKQTSGEIPDRRVVMDDQHVTSTHTARS